MATRRGQWRQWTQEEIQRWLAKYGQPKTLTVWLAISGLRGPSQAVARKLERLERLAPQRPVFGGAL